jgi:hypothetical protein
MKPSRDTPSTDRRSSWRSVELPWHRRVIPTSEEFDSYPVGVTVAPSGNVVATFDRMPVPCETEPCVTSSSNADFLTAAFTPATGELVWRDVYGAEGWQQPVGVVSIRGGVATCGSSSRPDDRRHVACVAYATSG